MTPKELCKRLQAIDEQLQQVRRQLIRCELIDAQFVPLLEEIVETLGRLRNEQKSALENKSSQQLLKSIRTRAIRANILLDSAVAFHFNVNLRPRVEVSYRSDGTFLAAELDGRISVHA